MTYKLALFDFDGTLANSFPFFLSVFNTIEDKHGFKRIDLARVDSMRHHGTREMMRHVGMPAWKLPLASKTFIDDDAGQCGEHPVLRGIPEALSQLAAAGVRLAVVSSNAENNVHRVLGPKLAGLISHFECGMSIFGKASRRRHVIAESGFAPGYAIYIGDQGTDACIFRAKVDTHSTPNWTLIPPQTGHPFQRKLHTDSAPNWTV